MESFNRMFHPRGVAVIGASANPKKMGYHALKSLMSCGFKGYVYPVNPRYKELFGLKTYPSIKEVPDPVDLAVVVVPSTQAPLMVAECGKRGIAGAVLITAGFKEAGLEEGLKLHEELAGEARRSNVKIIGPNTFGFVNLHANLNASFTPSFSALRRGPISLVSQSGGVCHVLMPYALEQGIGFSKIVGLGNRVNVDFPDMLDYLASDPDTRSVALYVEGVDNPRELMAAAKRTVKVKPVVAYKTGRSRAADEASWSHTGSLAGNYRLYEAAFKQAGVLTVSDSVELVSAAKALAFQPPARGRRVAVISLVAGLGIIAADTCEGQGLILTRFTRETEEALRKLLPPYTIRTNPVDLGFVANDPDTCGNAVEIVASDRNVDAISLNYIYSWSEGFMELPVKWIINAFKAYGKPLVMCLRYPKNIWDAEKQQLEDNGIPTFPTPELAAKSLARLCEYGEVLRKLGVNKDEGASAFKGSS
ncbi:MAG: CoA-binding protein [Candidatus Nezhaarchaeales archaeon]